MTTTLVRFEDQAEYFTGKPDAAIRTELKSNGFRWAPSIGAWQAYRNRHTLTTAKRMAGEPAPAEDVPAVADVAPIEPTTPPMGIAQDAAPSAESVPAVEIEATTPEVENADTLRSAIQADYENRDKTTFSNIKAGEAFQFAKDGPVFVKCRGGYRPGCGGELMRGNAEWMVYYHDSASSLTDEEHKDAGIRTHREITPSDTAPTTPAAEIQPEPVATVVETEDTSHLVAICERIDILGTIGTDQSIQQAKRERDAEFEFLGMPKSSELPSIDDDALLDAVTPATPDDYAKFNIRAKSGAWTASVYMIGCLYGLRFYSVDGGHHGCTSYATHAERMQALEAMARATTPPDTPPDGGQPIATVDAPTEAHTPPVAECTHTPTVAVSSAEFERIKPFNMDPRKLLENGVQAAQLIGLGVKYTGNMASPDGRGAITNVLDTRGDKCGSLRMDCTLEDGRVIHATPFYFTAELRPILQFDGKMHGAPYLAELAMAATLAKSQRTSAEELKKQAHSQALIDLAAKYPQLKRADSTSYGGTFAAKNIRILLKEAFNGQKFSVTSDYSKVSVNWIDGPTDAQVNEVIARFDIGASDMDTDYFYTVKTAFSELFGGVQYLSTTRETSDALIQQAINQLYQNEATRPTVSDWRKAEGVFDWRGNDYAIRQMRETLTGMSAYTAPKAKAKA